jgi:aspartate oxidase
VPFTWLALGGGDGKGGGERTTLGLCLKASHSAPRIAHVAGQAGADITCGITSAEMRHPLIDFGGDSVAVDLLFDEYYRIDNDGNSKDVYDNAGGEGTTVIGARVLDGCTGRGKAARTGLHGGNLLRARASLRGSSSACS